VAGAAPERDAATSAAAAAATAAAAKADPQPWAGTVRAGAFFDVDNTMMVGASIFHFAKGLAARKFFDWHDLVRFTVRQMRLRARGESRDDMHATRDSALAFVAGKKVSDIVALSEEIYDEGMVDKIWPGTHALARGHLGAGRQVWLVTATPQELAQIIADRLGLTGALGTVAETSDGAYTGRLVGDVLHGQAKADAVEALAAREELDLAQCTAYSDSINDLPLLSLVGTAVAVNPDSALRAEARDRGWEIRDFRAGRKVVRIGVPAALGASAVGGGVVAVLVMRQRARHAREAAEAAAAAALAARASRRPWHRRPWPRRP
jgi:HAD superfamily hydrolase (TIGR01490 family)